MKKIMVMGLALALPSVSYGWGPWTGEQSMEPYTSRDLGRDAENMKSNENYDKLIDKYRNYLNKNTHDKKVIHAAYKDFCSKGWGWVTTTLHSYDGEYCKYAEAQKIMNNLCIPEMIHSNNFKDMLSLIKSKCFPHLITSSSGETYRLLQKLEGLKSFTKKEAEAEFSKIRTEFDEKGIRPRLEALHMMKTEFPFAQEDPEGLKNYKQSAVVAGVNPTAH